MFMPNDPLVVFSTIETSKAIVNVEKFRKIEEFFKKRLTEGDSHSQATRLRLLTQQLYSAQNRINKSYSCSSEFRSILLQNELAVV